MPTQDDLLYADVQRRIGMTQPKVGTWVPGAAPQNLFDPQTLQQLQDMFSPYFNQQKSNMYQTLKNEQGFMGQQAGAQASAQGLANPGAYSSSAQNRLSSSWAPAFSQLQTGQMGQLLGAVGQQNQFGLQKWIAQNQIGMEQQQLNQQPDFWQYLLSGLIGAGGQLGSAGILAGGGGKKG